MFNKNIKKKWLVSSITDYKALEEYLTMEAKKGYILKEISKGRLVFEKGEPRDLEYNVSLFYPNTMFDYPDTEQAKDYRSICEDSGWTFCTSNEIYQIFYREEDDQAVAMHTDPHEEYSIIKKTFLRTEFITAFLWLLFIPRLYGLIDFNFENLLRNSLFFNSVILPIMINIIFGLQFIPKMIWFIKNKRRLKEGKNLVFNNYKKSRFMNRLNWTLIFTYLGMCVLGLLEIATVGNGLIILSIALLPSILAIIVAIIYKKKIRTVRRSRTKNIIILVALMLGVWMTSMVMVFLTMGSLLDMDFDDPLPKNLDSIKVLSLKDFGVDEKATTRAFAEKSIFVPINLEVREYRAGKDKDGIVNFVETTILISKSEKVSKYIFDEMILEKEDRYRRYETDYSKTRVNQKWNVDDGYYFMNRSEVLLLKGKRIIRIDIDADLSDDRIIKICKEKLDI